MKHIILLSIITLATLSSGYTSNAVNTQALNGNSHVQLSSIESGKLVLSNTSGYAWWSYVPKILDKNEVNYILVEQSNAGFEDIQQTVQEAKNHMSRFATLVENNHYIMMTLVFPRKFDGDYYPQGINYQSLQPDTENLYYRPDLKFNNILDEFLGDLSDAGYIVSEKIFVTGFSAGGMWSNRYTLLYPERVKATAIGQAGGWLAMPIKEYNGSTLNWPMGLGNFENLTGIAYSKQNVLKDVPQLIYIGDQDNQHTYYTEPGYGIYPNLTQIEVWGDSDPYRIENQYNYLLNNGYNVSFKLYPEIAHDYTTTMKTDVFNFFDSIKKLDTDKDGLTDDDETYLYGTSPNDTDSDDDGFSDFQEIENSYDPLDKNSHPPNSRSILGIDQVFTYYFVTLVVIANITWKIRKKRKL